MRMDLFQQFAYNDKIEDARARLDAWNLGCEMTLMVTRLAVEGVTSLGSDLREIQQKVSRLSANISSTTPLKLKEEENTN